MAALALLDEAVFLLRRASLATWLCHWIGYIPFALAFLVYWSTVTNPRAPAAIVLLESLGLAALLIWMNAWRTVFASRLQALLSGIPDRPWTAKRIARVTTLQSCLAATRLFVIPVAILTMFPMAGAVAFYRTATILSSRDDVETRDVFEQSRRAGQSWAILPVLFLLWLIVAVNVAITLLLLPELVRMFTGYESTFSRSGMYFAANGLFVWLAIAVTWLAFDPFLQAVYCVRHFRNESQETGEDLRAALRALRTVAVALLLAVVAHAAVKPDDLKNSIDQTLQSHEYDWRLPANPPANANAPLIVRLADRMIQSLKSFGRFLSKAIDRLLKWIFGERAPNPEAGQLPKSGLPKSVYALLAVVILIAAYIAWRKLKNPAAPSAAPASAFEAVHLESDDLTPDRLPEQSWLELAERCVGEGNLRLGLRALYLANLAWLGRVNLLTISKGKTNHEYELEFRRRARAFPGARERFTENIASFERAWYGLHDVAPEEFAHFRRRMDEMKAEAAA